MSDPETLVEANEVLITSLIAEELACDSVIFNVSSFGHLKKYRPARTALKSSRFYPYDMYKAECK